MTIIFDLQHTSMGSDALLRHAPCSYRPFLPILGTGLVTADGDLWQKQRTLMGPALRIDVLDDIIVIAKNSVDRLCKKLEPLRGTGAPVEINEEFRLLTLQVIGEAVLSMAPEDCDKVGVRRLDFILS
jgi:cytochrome P450